MLHRLRRPGPRPPAATAVGTVVVAAGAALVVHPSWFGLAGAAPFVWTVPFRVPVGLGALLGAGVLALAGRRWRRLLPSAVAVALVAGTSLGATLARGVGEGSLPAARPGEVTFLAANVLHTRVEPGVVARLAADTGAQAVSLPEATQVYADATAARVRAATGAGWQVFFRADARDEDGTTGTALLVADALGTYRVTDDFTGAGTAVVVAAPAAGGGPVLAAVHTAAPVPGLRRQWAREVPAVVDFCAATPGAIVGGDFNATRDHPVLADLRGCVDAGSATGTGARGTWRADLPALFGATIDHVLADGSRWRPVGSRVLDLPGSDHRAVVARWAPRSATS